MFKGVKKIKNVKYVGAPPPGILDKSNFDTLWSVTFTQSPGIIESVETNNVESTDESTEDLNETNPPVVEEPVS